jgi:dipeptidyl aminopeptidase/acylaminoacyl peptidase
MTLTAALTMADQSKLLHKQPWTAEDIVFQEYAGQFQISHNTEWVVWVKSVGDQEKDATVSRLFLSSLTDDREIQLTRGDDSVDQPHWSPDDQYIAFLSTRPLPKSKSQAAGQQIWLIRPNGGEPWALTELPKGPQQIAWLDKDTIIFSAEGGASLIQQANKKDDSIVVDDEAYKVPVRLYKVRLGDGKITELTSNIDQIVTWAASPDGKLVVARHRVSLKERFDQKVPSQVKLHDLQTGTEKIVLGELRLGLTSAFTWMTDSTGFYTSAYQTNHPKLTIAAAKVLYHYDCASGRTTQVNLNWENGLNWFGLPPAATNNGFIALLAGGTRFVLARYSINKSSTGVSWKQELLSGDHVNNLMDLTASNNGKTVVYLFSSASSMPQPYRAQLQGTALTSPRQFARLNDDLVRNRAFARSEIVRWKGAKDEKVEGVLSYPENYEAGKRYPLVTLIHGGPMESDHDLWIVFESYPVPLLNQRDAFVLRPNYHGSGNRGQSWVESICCGHYLEYEGIDVNKGVDYLVDKGLVDPDRIATMGWSYGSIVSINLITKYPERYKAAALGAGDVEYISDWGDTEMGHAFNAYYLAKTPMEDPELYVRKSPLFELDKVQTPVVIFQGTADTKVFPTQSWSFFRALQFYEKAPVKLVLLPGEPHVLEKPSHQLRVAEEEMAWLDKYLFKTSKRDSELRPSFAADILIQSQTELNCHMSVQKTLRFSRPQIIDSSSRGTELFDRQKR